MKNTYFLLKIKTEEKVEFKYGDTIKFSGIFKIPEEKRNYKGFDYRMYLKTKKIIGIIECDIHNVGSDSVPTAPKASIRKKPNHINIL